MKITNWLTRFAPRSHRRSPSRRVSGIEEMEQRLCLTVLDSQQLLWPTAGNTVITYKTYNKDNEPTFVHRGWDFNEDHIRNKEREPGKVDEGLPIVAPHSGFVVQARHDDRKDLSWGNFLVLSESPDGIGATSTFSHLQSFAKNLEIGQFVHAGQTIGFVGNTGNSNGPHLDFILFPSSEERRADQLDSALPHDFGAPASYDYLENTVDPTNPAFAVWARSDRDESINLSDFLTLKGTIRPWNDSSVNPVVPFITSTVGVTNNELVSGFPHFRRNEAIATTDSETTLQTLGASTHSTSSEADFNPLNFTPAVTIAPGSPIAVELAGFDTEEEVDLQILTGEGTIAFEAGYFTDPQRDGGQREPSSQLRVRNAPAAGVYLVQATERDVHHHRLPSGGDHIRVGRAQHSILQDGATDATYSRPLMLFVSSAAPVESIADKVQEPDSDQHEVSTAIGLQDTDSQRKTLVVVGTKGDDVIEISGTASEPVVFINDTVIKPEEGPFDSIYVDGRSGDDIISGRDSDLPLAAYGGIGQDVLLGSPQSDILVGGVGIFDQEHLARDGDRLRTVENGMYFVPMLDGGDYIHGAAGDDIIAGGRGDDYLFASEGKNTVFGDDDTDFLHLNADSIWQVQYNDGGQLLDNVYIDGVAAGIFSEQVTPRDEYPWLVMRADGNVSVDQTEEVFEFSDSLTTFEVPETQFHPNGPIKRLVVATGSGIDSIDVRNTPDNLQSVVFSGAGNDNVLSENADSIITGDGVDSILRSRDARRAVIWGGLGADYVEATGADVVKDPDKSDTIKRWFPGIFRVSNDSVSIDDAGELTAEITVSLNEAPANEVVVFGQTSSLFSLSPQLVSFTPSITEATFTVTGIPNNAATGDLETQLNFSVDDDLSDDFFDNVPIPSVDVSIIDTDVVAILADWSTVRKHVNEDRSRAAIDVWLGTKPSADVYVVVSSSDESEVSVSSSQIRFTPEDWMIPKTLNVTGVDDGRADGIQSSVITFEVAPDVSAIEYGAAPITAIEVINHDNDVGGLNILHSGGTTTISESGTSDAFFVSLTRQPLSNVTVAISSSDTGEVTVNRSRLTFTPVNWEDPQAVYAQGVPDGIVDPDERTDILVAVVPNESDDFFDAAPSQTIVATTTNVDLHGYLPPVANNHDVYLDEGQRVSFRPPANARRGGFSNWWIVGVSTPLSGTASIDLNDPTLRSIVYQNDSDGEGLDWFSYTVQDAFGGRATGQVIVHADRVNDPPTFNLLGDIEVLNTDGLVEYNNFVSDLHPGRNEDDQSVSVRVFVNNSLLFDQQPSVAPDGTLSFSVDRTRTGQARVTVEATDDGRNGGKHKNWSSNVFYINVNPAPALEITESNGTTDVTEDGLADSVFVALNQQPNGTVIVEATSADPQQVRVTNAVMFTPTNWQTPQRFEVAAVDDARIDGDITTSVTFRVREAAAGIFSVAESQTLSVLAEDNDLAALTLSESSGTTSVDEVGTTDTFRVQLAARPQQHVLIEVESQDEGETIAFPSLLTFSPGNWNVPQLVTVVGFDDAISDGTVLTNIELSVITEGSDPQFESVEGSVEVSVTDNDVVTYTIDRVEVDEGDGEVELVVIPSIPVSRNVDIDLLFTDGTAVGGLLDYDSTEQTVSFAAGSIVPQTIRVPIIVDGIVESDEEFHVDMQVSSETPVGTRSVDETDTATVTIVDNDAAPTASVVIDDGTAQRSMIRSITVAFDKAVTYQEGAFRLIHEGEVVAIHIDLTAAVATSHVTITFPGTIGGSLADGDYSLVIAGSLVKDEFGNELDGDGNGEPGGDSETKFFRFFGSYDGGRTIGTASYAQFIRTYRRRAGDPRFLSLFDWDGDGLIGARDFVEFRRRYRRTYN